MAWPVPVARTDRDIHVGTVQLGEITVTLQPQLDPRMAPDEVADARRQHSHGEGPRRGHDQRRAAARLADAQQAGLKLVQAAPDIVGQKVAGLRKAEPARATPEQLLMQARFQRLDLAADGTLGNTELRRRAAHVQMPGGGVEYPQRGERQADRAMS